MIVTHYSYMAVPTSGNRPDKRAPTAVYDLSKPAPLTRRELISRLMSNGELLARVPSPDTFCAVTNMVQLHNVLKLEGLM